jgi:signal peptidase
MALRSTARLLTSSILGLVCLAVVVVSAGVATGRWHVLPVLSDSMQPSLSGGSAVLAEREPLPSVREGDVIAYTVPVGDRRLLVHRVVEVIQGGTNPVVRTQGDANTEPDPWLARLEGESVWRIRGEVPYLGYAIVEARRPEARLGALGLALVLILLVCLRRIWGWVPRRTAGLPQQGRVG